jgi:osmotically-inducible protein OsmY
MEQKVEPTDEHVREEVSRVLERLPGIDVGNIELQVAEGLVTLTGTADDLGARRRAEVLIRAIPGVRSVDNGIRESEGRLSEALNDLSATGTGSTPGREPKP